MFNEADASTHHQLVYRDHSEARLHRGVPSPVSAVDRISVAARVGMMKVLSDNEISG
jgi:hypothetical protein